MMRNSDVLGDTETAAAVTSLARPPASGRAGDTGVRLSVTSDLSSIEDEWRDLEQRADCTPFQSFDWLATWQACIGSRRGVTPAIVMGRCDDGRVAFILPLAIERTPLLRRLVFLGRDLCDYNAPILSPDYFLSTTPEVWCQSVCRNVQNTRGFEHDVVYLDKMPETVGGRPNPLCALNTSLNASHAYATNLGSEWDTFYRAKRSAHARRADRRKRRLLEDNGDVRFTTAKDIENIAQTLDILFTQKGRWFARMGIPDLFAKPGHAAFFLTVAAKAADLVHISRIDVGSQCVAANLGLVFHGSYYSVLLSHDDGPLYRYSPGTFHHHELMRYAISRGCDTFDFTIGDEPFKRDWADASRDLYDYVAATSPLGHMSASLTSARLAAKRAIKQSPRLWALATHVRSAIGALKQRRTMPLKEEVEAVDLSTVDGVPTETSAKGLARMVSWWPSSLFP